MKKIITDEKLVDEILERGVETIYPGKELFKKLLLSGKRIKLYCGFDPSAPALHIGNAIVINKLAQFQALGHEVIFLIGDFTGMIGDPTDKSAARKKLTREEVLANAKNYVKQASAYLKFTGDNPAVVRYNSEWSDKVSFKDLLEITSNFTVQQMIQRDMFQERIKAEKPIFLHEFLYPVAQGYDSVVMDVDLEVGGNDQMFNMMAGRDLMKAMRNKEKFVMTSKLLADDTGKKMGKSEGNAIFLDTDPKNMYGIIMSWPDGVLGSAFELCTKVPMAEVLEIKKDLKDGEVNPRDLKMKLAFEITKIVHGEDAANEAQDNFVKTVQNKEVPDEVESIKVKGERINIVDLLVETKMASSKSEARRLIEQGGIKIDSEVVKEIKAEIKINKEGVLVQRGKLKFVRVIGE
ncbi:MAG: tyrosine--tRNA ligase [Patescibacteria group bacterium]|nr:tyrosine--tRNA ligase [Patescibacteria group bacterium]MDD4611241.1 tyrosine--tRNA ligase [Patescibacteria group bacterium]